MIIYPLLGQAEPSNTARAKYSMKEGFSKKTFSKLGLAPSLIIPLVQCSNYALAANTWQSYGTAERHVRRVEKYTGEKMSFPFTLKSTLTYVGYLLGVRKISGSSVEKYISGLRMCHLKAGHFSPGLRPDIIKMVITGAQNRDQLAKRLSGKGERLPVTIEMMTAIKRNLKGMRLPKSKKRLIWLTACLCWAGAFRIHEVLAREELSYDKTTTLMHQDLKLSMIMVDGENIDTLRVHLKHPKEERLSAGVNIDLFATGDLLCPITAYKKWLMDKVVQLSSSKPALRLADGRAYTGRDFNKDLKKVLGKDADYMGKQVTAHSFRAGLATMMSKAGYSDDEIMKMGRWHSTAFLRLEG
jgi:hypothetical protein